MSIPNLSCNFRKTVKSFASYGVQHLVATNRVFATKVRQQLAARRLQLSGANTTERRKAVKANRFREFFQHPLTWEKNNGFLNVIIGVGLLYYCLMLPLDEYFTPQHIAYEDTPELGVETIEDATGEGDATNATNATEVGTN